jgi:hypothetical protein
MKNIDTRIQKLEDVVKPNTPDVLVAFSRAEADQKLLEYKETHPGSAEPLMVVVEFVEASPSSER